MSMSIPPSAANDTYLLISDVHHQLDGRQIWREREAVLDEF